LERGALDSCGRRGKCETPEEKPRRLTFLPAESKCLERKSTGIIYKQKQQFFRKESFYMNRIMYFFSFDKTSLKST
jgi:hypothetical protein